MAGAKKHISIPLNGRWMTAEPASIGTNFRTLQNYRYTDTHIRGIAGHTAITDGTITGSAPKKAFHYYKANGESNLFIDGIASNTLHDCDGVTATAAGTVGTHTTNINSGHFCAIQDGQLLYCGNNKTLIYGGKEAAVGAFLTSTAEVSTDFVLTGGKDFTDVINNTKTDVNNLVNITDVFLVGVTRPTLTGLKIYTSDTQGTTASLSGKVWDGSTWNSLTISSDGTTSGGCTLAQTGEIVISGVAGVPAYIDGYYLYWYQFIVSTSINTDVTNATVKMPFQEIVDLWDGTYSTPTSAYQVNAVRSDITIKVLKVDYNADVDDTFENIILGANAGFGIEIGSNEKLFGVYLGIAGIGNAATTAMTAAYWNGSAFVDMTSTIDGTSDSGKSMNKSGVVTWYNDDSHLESKRSDLPASFGVASDNKKNEPQYFYQLHFDGNVTTKLDYIGCMVLAKELSGYAFAVFAQNRVLLCADNTGDKNKCLVSAKYLPQVFNGDDSVELFIGGDETLTAGCELFSHFGSNLYSLILLFKKNETWVISGQEIDEWENSIYPLSERIGCVANETLKTVNIPADPKTGLNRTVAIWLGTDGVYMSDGRSPVKISDDIAEYFDPLDSMYIDTDSISESTAFIDNTNLEYHLIFEVDDEKKELVYDVKRSKWFEIVRDVRLECGVEICIDGIFDSFGLTSESGDCIIKHLETGTQFGTTDISYVFEFGDFAPLGPEYITQLDKLKIIAPEWSSSDVTVTHTADTYTA